MVGPFVPNSADQSGSSLSGQWEQGQEIRLVQISMQFSVEWKTFPLDVGNIESPLKVLPVALPIPPWPVGIMTLKNRMPSPATELFIKCGREVVKPLAKRK